ncbi:MAG: primosomal protein N' [Oscillospiraceae bacterium]|jgi:primosomal protein N' (replication factor Y)|nr:primosomal protein N' [Oscillospiraceae bacterium]
MRYANVIVDIASPDTAKTYTYAIPDGMDIQSGMRVAAPFGHREIEGYVLTLCGECDLPPEKVKPITRHLDEGDAPAMLPELMELAKWMEGQYACLPVEALRLLIPAQMREGRIKKKEKDFVSLSAALTGENGYGEAIAKLTSRRAARQIETLAKLREAYPSPLERSLLPSAAVKSLVEAGYIKIANEEVLRRPSVEAIPIVPDPELTRHQSQVLSELSDALNGNSGSGGAFLLHGVTGSGKTEVYIRLAKLALETGKGVIVLVPEIALTPQMTSWFHARFGDNAAVLHSKLTSGERFDEWRRIRRGDARVVIGARSAVFAPVERLGVIVVDEEHEQSYQSERHPCYDAREVAEHRCKQAGAVLLLSSATPSLPDFKRAMSNTDGLKLLTMPKRVLDRPLPEAELIDMRREIMRGNFSVLSGRLAKLLSDCVRRGDQAILLMNRRGHSTFISCRECGYVERCEQCDVSMTYHQKGDVLRCHYCSAERRPPTVCPSCGGKYIRFFGAGTQKVEEAVLQLLPGVSLIRMDSDTARASANGYVELLHKFREGEASIMIGTQMIAKGLDFPDVTLVGVIAADATLHLPDYRSPERAFQLITQAAGRAGRSVKKGRVVIQCYDPEHYAIASAREQDYRRFYEEEIVHRKNGLYPPYTKMTRLLYEGENPGLVAEACDRHYEQMKQFFDKNKQLRRGLVHMNARPAPIQYIKGQTRWQLFLKLYTSGSFPAIIAKLREFETNTPEGVSVALQIDPPSLL